ncbi:MAG TPA: hypothetical protein VGF75_00740 [Candidatus Saccharimonadales bacterium]|jgi:hypothetical protein
MSGQSANMSRSESISMQKKIERGPGATPKGSGSPNSGPKGMDVCVPKK